MARADALSELLAALRQNLEAIEERTAAEIGRLREQLREQLERGESESRRGESEIRRDFARVEEAVRAGSREQAEILRAIQGAIEAQVLASELRAQQADRDRDIVVASAMVRGDMSGKMLLAAGPEAEPPKPPAAPTAGADLDTIVEAIPAAGRTASRLRPLLLWSIPWLVAAGTAATAGGLTLDSCRRSSGPPVPAAVPDLAAPLPDLSDARPAPAPPRPEKPKKPRPPKPDKNRDAMVPSRAPDFSRWHECTGAPSEPESCGPRRR